MNAPVVATVSSSPAKCYHVRNGWAWANIYVRHGTASDRPSGDERHWVEVAVNGDYGSFAYCWSHIGEDWRAFLAGLDMHYAMQKFMGQHFRVPVSIDEAEQKGRETILLYRREGAFDTADARRLWDALDDADRDYDLSTFLRSWDDHSGGLWYARDWWDMCWDKVNPQAEGFWREVWPHFVAHIGPPPPADAGRLEEKP